MSRSSLSSRWSRRELLHRGLVGSAGLFLADSILADPYSRPAVVNAPARPVRVRGRVHADARGIAGVAVSDGVDIVETAADGGFELITSDRRPFVQVTVPSGYTIPRSATGTARFYAPIEPGVDEMAADFALAPLRDGDHDHAALLLADPQTQTAEEMAWMHEQTVPDVRRTIEELGDLEVFGIADGDIMYDDLSLYGEYERAVGRLGVPFFQVVGNHDLDFGPTDASSTATFCSRFGPRYFSFERGLVHYVVLDDVFWHGEGYIGYLTDETLSWLERDLARVERGRPVIVATHIPLLGSFFRRSGEEAPLLRNAVANRERLYRLLEPFAAHVLTGHTHENEHVFEYGVHEHVSGTVCGAWWSGPICWDGTPSGYAVYEIRGEQVTWRYKSTGLPAEHQIRCYPRGADPTAPDEIVANIWDWDPEWTVLWYEGGERRGPMARRLGRDPQSVTLHEGENMPPHRPWVEPRLTDHLFYAPVSDDAAEIVVEATDRFGRTYTARAPRPSRG